MGIVAMESVQFGGETRGIVDSQRQSGEDSFDSVTTTRRDVGAVR